MKLMLQIIMDMDNGADLSDGSRSYIYALADNENNMPGMLAKTIRMQIDTSFQYKEPIYINDSLQTRTKTNKKVIKLLKKHEVVTIYPSPAKDYVIVDYKNATTTKDVILVVTDMQGRLQMKQTLKNITSFNFVDIHKLINGMYNFTIFADGKQKASNKIVIQH